MEKTKKMDRVAKLSTFLSQLKGEGHFGEKINFWKVSQCRKTERGDALGFLNTHSVVKYQRNWKGDPLERKNFRKKFSQCRKTGRGTLWGFSTSILSQNIKKLKGDPLGKIYFSEKQVSQCQKNWKGGNKKRMWVALFGLSMIIVGAEELSYTTTKSYKNIKLTTKITQVTILVLLKLEVLMIILLMLFEVLYNWFSILASVMFLIFWLSEAGVLIKVFFRTKIKSDISCTSGLQIYLWIINMI